MRITKILESSSSLRSTLRNAFIDFSHMTLSVVAVVTDVLRDGKPVNTLKSGEAGAVILDRSPFYVEAGGQVGDTGTITTETGVGRVEDTQNAIPGLISHHVRITSGDIRVDQDTTAEIEHDRRERIRKSHTGTHILHSSLRRVLGDQANQAGSLVESGRLRFDFNHHQAVNPEELMEVERLANEHIIENARVRVFETSKQEAEAMGAIAFFGDKYGEVVRVVRRAVSLASCAVELTPSPPARG